MPDSPRDLENTGHPPLALGRRPVSFFEFWPAWVFYLPVALYWMLLALRYRSLGLPMVVNPHIELGGMIGESKLDILDSAGQLARPYILPYIVRAFPNALRNQSERTDSGTDSSTDSSTDRGASDIRPTDTRIISSSPAITPADLASFASTLQREAETAGIYLPFVVKPEYGCRGKGVRVVHCLEELVSYLGGFPQDERFIIQTLAPYSSEAGVFYERFPSASYGKVTSLTLKYRPYVIGDGSSSLKALILADPRARLLQQRYFSINAERLHRIPAANEIVALAFAGSHCRGSIFRNGNAYISDALSHKIDQIMQDFPEFHYGRLDIKFADIDTLVEGKDFVIIEVNGVSSEKTHIWDARTSFFSAMGTLLEQYSTLFAMGDAMRRRGFKVPSVNVLLGRWWRERKNNSRYPATG